MESFELRKGSAFDVRHERRLRRRWVRQMESGLSCARATRSTRTISAVPRAAGSQDGAAGPEREPAAPTVRAASGVRPRVRIGSWANLLGGCAPDACGGTRRAP